MNGEFHNCQRQSRVTKESNLIITSETPMSSFKLKNCKNVGRENGWCLGLVSKRSAVVGLSNLMRYIGHLGSNYLFAIGADIFFTLEGLEKVI